MDKTIVSSITTPSDHHHSSGRVSAPMCLRCHYCTLCNCRECQHKLCVDYCTTCRCYWRPSYCTICGKHTGYTQTYYPPMYDCTKLAAPSCCSPSCCPPTCCPTSCSCVSTCTTPAYVSACTPPDCSCVTVPSRRTGYTQTCYQPPPYNPCPALTTKTYCYICHKYV